MKTNIQASSMAVAAIMLIFCMPFNYYWVKLYDNDLMLKGLQEEVQSMAEEYRIAEEFLDEIVMENAALRQENEHLKSEHFVGRIIYNGPRGSNKVALTIDDGWEANLVEKALDYLKEEGAKATLFPVGVAVESSPNLWRRAVQEGHELGNHTYSHRFLTTIGERQIRREIDLWQKEVDSALGYSYPTRYFRPPGMAGFTPQQGQMLYYQSIIARNGLAIALWDIETFYTLYSLSGPRRIGANLSPNKVAAYIAKEAKAGSIILLHFIPLDVEALPALIRGLREKGLEPVTLSEMLYEVGSCLPITMH